MNRRGPKVKHGLTHSNTYNTWAGMLTRCNNIKHGAYKHYGGRGITVCERWKKFANFLEDMGERPEGLTLDRIDNDGNYEPGNCRWITHKENCNNKGPRRNVKAKIIKIKRVAIKLKQLIVSIPTSIHQQVKEISTMKNVSLKTFVWQAILEKIKEEKKYE